jgi:hypothetical protein
MYAQSRRHHRSRIKYRATNTWSHLSATNGGLLLEILDQEHDTAVVCSRKNAYLVGDEATTIGRLKLLLLGAGLIAIAVMLWKLASPITGFHSFRQSQTAISTYWMLHGGGWFDYETPVLGYPWSVPFEFPLYNWIVASFSELSSLPLDVCGRLVSMAWLFACLAPVYMLTRSYRLPVRTFLVFAILFLASPLYVFWGRAFLMETQALCLSLAYLAAVRQSVTRGGPWWILAAVVFGALAALTKITTLFSFFLLAGVILGIDLLHALRDGKPWLRALPGAAVMLVLPLVPFAIWNRHADLLKSGNAIARFFRSDTPVMTAWNFGSLHERFSFDFVRAFSRGCLDILGWLAPVILGVLVVGLLARRARGTHLPLILVLLTAFMLPWLVITHLYIAHNYYLAANGLLLIAALAVMMGELGGRRLILACSVILLSQYGWFATRFVPNLRIDPKTDREIEIAEYVRMNTRDGDVIAIYGLDWSSVVAYYSQRRAVMEPEIMVQFPKPVYMERIDHLMRPVGGAPMTAVVRCPSPIDADPDVAKAFDALSTSMRTKDIGDCRVFTKA